MKILLIGNGFDLAHKLPTKYEDFLAFCEEVRTLYTYSWKATEKQYRQNRLDCGKLVEDIKNEFSAAFRQRTQQRDKDDLKVVIPDPRFTELCGLVEKNVWIDYFLERQNRLAGKNWIDFEAEISDVIQALDTANRRLQAGETNGLREPERFAKLLQGCGLKEAEVFNDKSAMYEFTARLRSDLDKLTRALEIYIAGFVEKLSPDRKDPDIEKLDPDHILSFNYSNTYQRLYGGDKALQYDYIHGKARLDGDEQTCGLVLGIDEYLDDDRKNKDLSFLTFKKFYQRIYKGTGSGYLSWLAAIEAEGRDIERKRAASERKAANAAEKAVQREMSALAAAVLKRPTHELYIFGHSLDVTDRDVLRRLLCCEAIRTKIYYHRKDEKDKQSLADQIKNLIAIIGQDELIRKTGGPHKAIEFVPQTLPPADPRTR